MVLQAAPYEQFLSLDSVTKMGAWSIAWIVLVAFLVLAARAKKIGTTSIGKNEWGMLEIFGFPLVPIPFGLWPFVKGIFHVKQVSTAPVRIDFPSRREVSGRVLLVVITVLVKVTSQLSSGNWWQQFLCLRRDLIAAMYGTLDENIDDSENPERIQQTQAALEAASRNLLKEAENVDVITLDALNKECGEELRTRFGEYIDRVYIREDAPVDGQLWKDGRLPLLHEDDTTEDAPPVPIFGLKTPNSA